ncbi:MAG: ATP synthase F1 subunit epsilon [Bacteroidales bacterium]|jgi:F-type H+-transporting ATPase subunit epsilon|nr:ATP synthase F1 subunit epsilon [Bacteroidales bacterium]MBO7180591.1 ATP synthase F1 subunit epsilon [Bacteroidales bacterium]MBO7229101.1 ATP synthase F1 subunit epsilon [Bacteroidales bacterium]MBQ1191436.1 ATP synthase F1 subunit epsilon [Bacteroidales bacterium]MBQ2386591.1 ATP synthase F1 subunit epsilon [Bacteroidales bacterium]
MKLNIITPEDTLYEGEVKSVQLQGTDGKFQLLNNHAPIISALAKGKIKITDNNDQTIEYEINGGLVEMSKNKIQILAQ